MFAHRHRDAGERLGARELVEDPDRDDLLAGTYLELGQEAGGALTRRFTFAVGMTTGKGMSWSGDTPPSSSCTATQSGYLVLIGADQAVKVLRADPGSPMAQLGATTFSPDPTVDDVEVRVELIDDHFRVYVDDVVELDFDIAPGDVIAPGADLAGLISFDGPASFERFDVAQALSPAFEEAFDAGCGDWLPGCLSSGWQVTGAAGSERLEAPESLGLSLQTLDTSGLPPVPATPSSFELSARVVPHEDASNWAGVFLHQSGSFWTSSYLVFVKSNGEVGLRIPGQPVLTTSVTLDPVAEADLKVRVVGDRLTVSVDHCPVFDEVDSLLAAGDLGLASFRNSVTGASALFDDVELTILPD